MEKMCITANKLATSFEMQFGSVWTITHYSSAYDVCLAVMDIQFVAVMTVEQNTETRLASIGSHSYCVVVVCCCLTLKEKIQADLRVLAVHVEMR